MRALRLLLLACALALATLAVGWWGLPLTAFAAGALLASRRRIVSDLTLAGVLAWSSLLAWDATQGPVMVLAARLAPVFSLPGAPLFLLLPLLYAALLAWSASTVGEAVSTLVRRKDANESDLPAARDRASA